MVRGCEFLAERADRRVCTGGFGGHHHPHAVARRGDRIRIRVGHLDGAMQPAEDVDLVGRLEQVLEKPDGLRCVAVEFEYFVGSRIPPIDAGRERLGRRIAIGMHRGQYRASGAQV